MSELRFEPYVIPSAELGPENPLPPLQKQRGVNFVQDAESDIPAEDTVGLGYGFDLSLLPYRMQDGYNRARRERAWNAAILENHTLRAVFLPELGGRLWSLLHKPSGRELLYKNPVFQPANLATRNSWFSGGVEWNVSVPGHCPLTCSPLFAARVDGPGNEPILRLYEWERARQIPFQIEAFLPDGAEFLYIRIGILNPHDNEVPMYWWSNIAVPEREDIRVLTPSDYAYKYAYRGGLQRVPIPLWNGTDVTYATNAEGANDFFFRVPDGQRPWIAALDGQGSGLVQTSTSRLVGRKLFVWGMRPGGRRWQEYLSQAGEAYMEIQAGLARTQSHCLPMPPRTQWSWVEAYGLLESDSTTVHGDDWSRARRVVDDELENRLPAAHLDAIAQAWEPFAGAAPQIVRHGSGWGALERRRREFMNEAPLPGSGLPFSGEALGDEQAPWLELLECGAFPERDVSQEPGAWMVQSQWRELLENAVQNPRSDHWLAWLHLGVMRYDAGENEGARMAWEASLRHARNAWALRNLAVLEKENPQSAAALYLEAARLAPHVTRLVIECCEALLQAERAADAVALIEDVPELVRCHSRVQLLRARAALALDDLETVNEILAQRLEFADIREGEVSLSNLWFAMHEKRVAREENLPMDDELKKRVRAEFPPPPHLDFRLWSS